MDMERAKSCIERGQAVLGIELGSTRIKAVLIDENHAPIAQGSQEWENHLVDGIWTYGDQEIWDGLRACYADLKAQVKARFGLTLKRVKAMGFSAMMHGYLAFDQDDRLLVPFRTWRNTITGPAADELTRLFNFNIPQRWSVAHLYQAILNGEAHVPQIRFITTLSGYVHYRLTGRRVLGVGDASGMFPIDSAAGGFDASMMRAFDAHISGKGFPWKLEEILPQVLSAGQDAGTLTPAGARLLDPQGDLEEGIPLCPPEGDAGTGMTATGSVRARTGNVSAGTSIFAMIVLEKPVSKVHTEINMVTTPSGAPVAMAHCNNCTSDLNAWVGLFAEFLGEMGVKADMGSLFETLYTKALTADPDLGGLMAYNYYSGEPMTGLENGRPLFMRAGQPLYPGQLHVRPSVFGPGLFKAGHGHPDRSGTGEDRFHTGPRRILQDQGRGPAHVGRGPEPPGERDGDRGRGRRLGHGAAGRLRGKRKRHEPGRLSGSKGVHLHEERNLGPRGPGRPELCGLYGAVYGLPAG